MHRRLLVSLLLALMVATSLVVAAQAASTPGWKGVVVAKDASRKAVVVALPGGIVRTVRTTAPLGRFAVGARVRATGTRLSDGTFRGRTLRVTGKAARSVVRGVVVKVERRQGRLLLSAGGSVFAVGRTVRRGVRTTQSSGSPDVGDRVEIVVSLQTGAPQATAVQTVGQATAVQLAGIVTGNVAPANGAAGKLTLAVVKKGLVDVAVPATITPLPAFVPGDEVVLHVSVDQAGAFTLVSAQAGAVPTPGAPPARGDEDDDEDEDELEVKGILTAVSPATVQRRSGATTTCAVPTGTTIPATLVGALVELKCVDVAGVMTLRRLEQEGPAPLPAGASRVTGILAASGTSAVVTPAGAPAVTCAIPAGTTVPADLVGKLVVMTCQQATSGLTLTSVTAATTASGGHGDDDEDDDDDHEGHGSGDDDD